MERREAQHPGGRPRKPAAVAVRAPGGGLRNPALEPRRADRPIARVVQRGLASPWRHRKSGLPDLRTRMSDLG